jgi:hypothetical protein
MDPILLRALERIADVVFAGMAILLGYLLFLKVPTRTDSSGNIKLPGGVHVYLTRVGPGVFFALFGTGLIAASFFRGIDATSSPGAVQSERPAPIHYSGSMQEIGPVGQDPVIARIAVEREIVVLNSLPASLRPDLEPKRREEMIAAVPAIKLSLLKSVWNPDWGDEARFENWVLKGANSPTPVGSEQVAEEFRRGTADR